MILLLVSDKSEFALQPVLRIVSGRGAGTARRSPGFDNRGTAVRSAARAQMVVPGVVGSILQRDQVLRCAGDELDSAPPRS
jgi:hypothetical protein